MASLANSQLAWANFISLPEGFARPAKWQDVTPIRAPALDSNGIERTPPNPALSEKLKNGTQSSSVVHIRNENRQLHARRTGADRSRRYGHFPKLIEKARRKFALRNDTQPFEFGVVQLGRSKSCVQMLTHPLRQMVHDCDLVRQTKQPVSKPSSRPLHAVQRRIEPKSSMDPGPSGLRRAFQSTFLLTRGAIFRNYLPNVTRGTATLAR